MLSAVDEPAKVTSTSPCGVAGQEKAAGTLASTVGHRAWPRDCQNPHPGDGDGDGGEGGASGGRRICWTLSR